MSTLDQMLKELKCAVEESEEPKSELQKAGEASKLKELYDSINVKHSFKPGDLVQTKPGLNHKKVKVGIVSKILDAPVFDKSSNPGSPYFNEALDIIMGKLGSGGVYVECHLDSRRLEPYSGPTIDSI